MTAADYDKTSLDRLTKLTDKLGIVQSGNGDFARFVRQESSEQQQKTCPNTHTDNSGADTESNMAPS